MLNGTVRVLGSKNAALPLLAASLLTDEPVVLHNIPAIADVKNMLNIMSTMGAVVARQDGVVRIQAKALDATALPPDTVGRLRGSILLLGALLGRNRKVTLPRPGGDVIGARPIDAHLDAFSQLGVGVVDTGAVVSLNGQAMAAGEVVLREFSVTATENVLLAAAALPGTTTIHLAAAEPHVIALGRLLEQMGTRISGLGTHTITVTGSGRLAGAEVTNIPDMLEAGLFVLLGATCGGKLMVENVPVEDLRFFFKKLDELGVQYTLAGNSVEVRRSNLKGFSAQTLPHPGLATDLQAPFAVAATQAQGTSLIHDPMYESRFKHCDELVKMGARVTVCDPHRVIIQGPTQLQGRHILSLDIRSGATLVLAGLIAHGVTTIDSAEIIDRGYERLEERLRALGAHITRVQAPAPVNATA